MGQCEKTYVLSGVSRLRVNTDGEGIRSLIFIQGCPLRCKMCINKFTWGETKKTIQLTARELYELVRKDRIYLLASGGGVSFGGGEPLSQPQLIKEFYDVNKDGYSINIETSLNVPWSNVKMVAAAADMFYVDIKTTNSEKYYAYTGGKLEIALGNLRKLYDMVGKDRIVVRIPCIPGLVDEKEREKTRAEIAAIGISQFDLFTYIGRDALSENVVLGHWTDSMETISL